MKKRFLKVLTIGILTGGLMFSSTQALAINNNGNQAVKAGSATLLAKNDSLKDGEYNVTIQTLKEKENDLSMAGQYIGQKVKLEVKNGQIYAIVDITRLDWMKNINIFVNGADTKYDMTKGGSQAGTLRFKVPSTKAKIKFKMNVEPMGNARVSFRVVMQNDVKQISESAPTNSTIENDAVNDAVNKSKSNEEDLPQTGLPITQAELPMIGGLTTIAGIFLLKKKSK